MKRLTTLPGSGIFKGMGVTALNLIGSFYDPKRLITVEYPEERIPQPEFSRNFPFLIYDGDDPEAGLRCVACRICERECPPQAIRIEAERDEKGKPAKRPAVFEIDLSTCMSCQICVEVCPFDAIKMDKEYRLNTEDRIAALVHGKEQLAKSSAYYHTICPGEAAEVDARFGAEKKRKEATGKPGKEASHASA